MPGASSKRKREAVLEAAKSKAAGRHLGRSGSAPEVEDEATPTGEDTGPYEDHEYKILDTQTYAVRKDGQWVVKSMPLEMGLKDLPTSTPLTSAGVSVRMLRDILAVKKAQMERRAEVPHKEPARRGSAAYHEEDREKDHRRRASVATQLREKAEKVEADRREVSKQAKKRKRRRRKKRRSRSHSGTESRSDCTDRGRASSSSSSPFREALHLRSSNTIRRIAEKDPGALSKQGLAEMAKQLPKGGGEGSAGGASGEGALRPIVMVYLMTYLIPSLNKAIPQGPLREMKTLAAAMDKMLHGRTDEGCDIVMQRFRALEMSLRDGTWKVAKHIELVADEEGSTSLDVREVATKEAVREAKLQKHLEKSRKREATPDQRR